MMQLQMHSIVELLFVSFPLFVTTTSIKKLNTELKEAAKIVKDYNSHWEGQMLDPKKKKEINETLKIIPSISYHSNFKH